MLADAAIARSHADDAIAVIEHLGRRKAREDVNAFGFDQAAEPLDEPVERDDVVAVIPERRRGDRKLHLAGAGEEVDVIVRGLRRRVARPCSLKSGTSS